MQEAAFAALAEAPVPEMQRSDLTGTVLQLKALGIDNILNFDWLSPPPAEALVRPSARLPARATCTLARNRAHVCIPETSWLGQRPAASGVGLSFVRRLRRSVEMWVVG
jgi:HrpA-like RNA helicase